MSRDQARLTVLIDVEKKKEFERLCEALGTNPSVVVRQLIRDHLRGDSSLADSFKNNARGGGTPRKGRID